MYWVYSELGVGISPLVLGFDCTRRGTRGVPRHRPSAYLCTEPQWDPNATVLTEEVSATDYSAGRRAPILLIPCPQSPTVSTSTALCPTPSSSASSVPLYLDSDPPVEHSPVKEGQLRPNPPRKKPNVVFLSTDFVCRGVRV